MAFYNVKVQRTERFVYLIEATSQAEAETKAVERTQKSEIQPYNVATAVRSVLVDPDTI